MRITVSSGSLCPSPQDDLAKNMMAELIREYVPIDMLPKIPPKCVCIFTLRCREKSPHYLQTIHYSKLIRSIFLLVSFFKIQVNSPRKPETQLLHASHVRLSWLVTFQLVGAIYISCIIELWEAPRSRPGKINLRSGDTPL
jgi:hypothetical protein